MNFAFTFKFEQKIVKAKTEKVKTLEHLLRKPMDWFLYDNGLRHERVNKDKRIVSSFMI